MVGKESLREKRNVPALEPSMVTCIRKVRDVVKTRLVPLPLLKKRKSHRNG
jgi:hypothetical protein